MSDGTKIGWLTDIYKDIHRHPELGMKEYRTTALVKSILSELGVEQIGLPGMDVGAACILRGARPGPTLAIRADMDALPIQEKAPVEYASEVPGVMHACGHDLNTTVLLGVLRKAVEGRLTDRISGNLKFIFQPAEETLGGAKRMIEAGVLKNPDVDMILMSHGDPDLHVGEVAVFKGYSHANSDNFFIDLIGTGGHGSRPFQTQDLILAGSYLVNIFQSIVSRDLDARDAQALHVRVGLEVCSFNAGTASNILPSSGRLTGTVRTLSDEVRATVRRRMEETCASMASLFHMDAALDYQVGVPSCVVDEKAEFLLSEAAAKHLPRESILSSKTRMGGEDFAYFSRLVPAGVLRLGITPPGKAKYGSTHSPTFQIDFGAVPVGVAILSQAAEDFLVERK